VRKWFACLAALIACAGIALIVVGKHTHRWAPPPAPPAWAARAQDQELDRAPQHGPHPFVRLARPAVPQAPELSARPMRRSLPVRVRIPAIGVNARIISLGLGYGDVPRVPSLSTPMLASWFDGGVTPGQIGPAVLSGHVDAAVTGPAVFYRLGDLRPGNLVYVTRADRRTAVFRVRTVNLYSEWGFPDHAVYGSTSSPVLRLVTCGGQYDTKTHLYLDRTVAYARYLGQER
jgi:sortase (surface protein transpeptidase)